MVEDEEIEVTLDVEARGQVKVKMKRSEYEQMFPEDDPPLSLNLTEVPGLDWDDVVNALEFEVTDTWVDADLRKSIQRGG